MQKHPAHSNLLRFNLLANESSLAHFVTTVSGGVSKDAYSTFNLGEYCGDSPENVKQNRRRLSEMLGVEPYKLFVPYQTHEDKICVVDGRFLSQPNSQQAKLLNGVDALITNQPHACIGVTTADCVPLLVYDPVNCIFAAIHAGWRGTAAGIAGKTVQRMIVGFSCNPKALKVGIGPHIGVNAFEVGDDVAETFREAGYSPDTFGYKDNGKYHIDLAKCNVDQLLNVGIEPDNIEISGICTYTASERCFSARRQGIQSGRMLTGGFLL